LRAAVSLRLEDAGSIHRGGIVALGCTWFFFLLVCLRAPATAGVTLPPARNFDSTKGEIDGKPAFAFWPSTSSDSSAKPGDPAGFEAHIAFRSDLDTEAVHTAGEWFVPPSEGVFLVWLESPSRYLMSTSPTPLIYKDVPFNGHGIALVGRVIPAGRVRLAAPVCGGGCTFGLIHANSHIWPDGGIRPEMRRSEQEAAAVERGALMPAGVVAAMLYDKRLKVYRAIEAPVAVTAGQTVVVHAKPPGAGSSDLVVVFTRPQRLHKVADEDVIPRLVLGSGKSLPPVFTVSGYRRLYAIWKGVAAGKATLRVESKVVRLPDTEIVLRPERVESVEASLAPLPRLGVLLDLPEELRRSPIHVSISGTRARLAKIARDVAADAERVDFAAMPAVPLRVSVVAGPWELEAAVDLSDGKDSEVTVAAQLISLEGTLYYGENPRQGEIAFLTNHGNDKVTVKADGKGHYHAVLARPMTYILMVQFPDRGRPFLMGLDVAQSGRQDLRVPANDYQVRVVRADTGAPISQAKVAVVNTGIDATTHEEFTQGQSLETGVDGLAHAMPLRPGEVKITARARRFAPAETLKDKVPDQQDFSREIEISLRPLEGDNPVALVLASGQPALGAELWVQPDPIAPPLILSADETGTISLPDSAAGEPLLVRAPGAASGIVVWDGQAESIALAPAGPPLTVEARKPNGDPGAWAACALWIDGARYTGFMLRWAFGGQQADRDGVVVLQGLPARPLQVLFWSPKQQTASLAETGAFDSRRHTVSFPWPAVAIETMVE